MQRNLVSHVGQQLIDVYETLEAKNLNQTMALQLIFDLKFLQAIIIPRDNKVHWVKNIFKS